MSWVKLFLKKKLKKETKSRVGRRRNGWEEEGPGERGAKLRAGRRSRRRRGGGRFVTRGRSRIFVLQASPGAVGRTPAICAVVSRAKNVRERWDIGKSLIRARKRKKILRMFGPRIGFHGVDPFRICRALSLSRQKVLVRNAFFGFSFLSFFFPAVCFLLFFLA